MSVEDADIGLVAKAQCAEQLVGGAQHLARGIGGLESEYQGVGRTYLGRSRSRSADGVLGEFVKPAHATDASAMVNRTA